MRQKTPTILFLMETKLSIREMEPIKTELGYPSMLDVSSEREVWPCYRLPRWLSTHKLTPQTI